MMISLTVTCPRCGLSERGRGGRGNDGMMRLEYVGTAGMKRGMRGGGQ